MDMLEMRVRKLHWGLVSRKTVQRKSQDKKAGNLEYQSDKLHLLELILGGWRVHLSLNSYRVHQTDPSKHVEEVLAVVPKLVLQVGEAFVHDLLWAEHESITNDEAACRQTA